MFSPNRNTKLKRARVRAREGKEDDERNIAAIGWQHKKNFCVNDVSVRHFNGVLRMRRMHITLFDFDSESPQDFFAFGKLSKMLFFSSKLWGFGVCLGCMSARASERQACTCTHHNILFSCFFFSCWRAHPVSPRIHFPRYTQIRK